MESIFKISSHQTYLVRHNGHLPGNPFRVALHTTSTLIGKRASRPQSRHAESSQTPCKVRFQANWWTLGARRSIVMAVQDSAISGSVWWPHVVQPNRLAPLTRGLVGSHPRFVLILPGGSR